MKDAVSGERPPAPFMRGRCRHTRCVGARLGMSLREGSSCYINSRFCSPGGLVGVQLWGSFDALVGVNVVKASSQEPRPRLKHMAHGRDGRANAVSTRPRLDHRAVDQLGEGSQDILAAA